jgi:predicted ATPase
MSHWALRFRTIFSELKRRNVVQVTIAYVVAAAFVIQLIDMVDDVFILPPRTLRFAILIAVAGLPIAAVLAWIYDLVPDSGPAATEDPAVPALSAEAATEVTTDSPHPAPLPAASTPFIGRVRELDELVELLGDDDTRLITIVGPGGAGKTRLALESARRSMSKFAHGVAYIPLGSLPTPDVLPEALALALGVPLARRTDPLDEIIDFLRDRQVLLVLDNFDTLAPAAVVLARILECAPRVRLLVTSRERLHLLEETLVPVDGLRLGADSDAVALFVSAARRQDRRFSLNARNTAAVERICTLLGGMPLAVELAAAWVRILSCDEILAELGRDIDILSSSGVALPDRHSSLRATFDASWRLLSAVEKSALSRLSVLRSAFDREAAAVIAGADVPVLRALLEKSLLSRESERFVMLEVVRQYAVEQLQHDEAAEAEARGRHMTYFGAMLARVQQDAARWDRVALERIAGHIDDVRAAWSHAVDSHATEFLLDSTDALFHFYDARGWVREGLQSFGKAAASLDEMRDHATTDAAADLTPRRVRARLDVRQGVLHGRVGELALADSLLRKGLEASRALGEDDEVVFALNRLGSNCLLAGEYAHAEVAHREALTLSRSTGDTHAEGWSLAYLGNVAWAMGDYAAATSHHTAAIALLRTHSDLNGMCMSINSLAAIAYVKHDHEAARQRLSEGIALQRELRNQRSAAMLLHNLGSTEILAQRYDDAQVHLQESLTISLDMGYRRMSALSLVALADLALQRDRIGDAADALQRALRAAADADHTPVALETLLGCARLLSRMRKVEDAIRLASVVARHPASDEDARQKATALLSELNAYATDSAPSDADLHSIMAELLAEMQPRLT